MNRFLWIRIGHSEPAYGAKAIMMTNAVVHSLQDEVARLRHEPFLPMVPKP